MSPQVVTPPHRTNPDWYRVKYRLASTLTNDAYVNGKSYDPAAKAIDELLQACWQQMPVRGRRRDADPELQSFAMDLVEPAALDLKALIELGRHDYQAGAAKGWDLPTVRKLLQEEKPVPPLTIVEAILCAKQLGRSLLFDLACFFQLAGDSGRARRYSNEAFATVPAADLARMRARVAADPMLSVIPGVAAPAVKPKKGKKAKKDRGKSKQPAPSTRPWI